MFALHGVEINDPVDVDFGTFCQIQEIGMLQAYGLFCEEDLVGYLVVTLAPSPMRGGRLIANEEGLYIAQEHRGGGAATSLLLAAENHLRDKGVNILYMAAPNSRVAKLYERKGYKLHQTIYEKEL